MSGIQYVAMFSAVLFGLYEDNEESPSPLRELHPNENCGRLWLDGNTVLERILGTGGHCRFDGD